MLKTLDWDRTPAIMPPLKKRASERVILCQNNPQMSPPSTIAHYRITAKIGEGGMGDVCRAPILGSNRDVAIKVLPEGSRRTTNASRGFNARRRCSRP